MNVIKVQAKVPLVPEEQMEAEATYDLGNIAKNKEWGWRNMGMEVYEIYRIVEYDKSMSVIITMDNEKILIKEKFDSLFARWQDLKKEEPEPEKDAPSNHAVEEGDDEEDDEDDN